MTPPSRTRLRLAAPGWRASTLVLAVLAGCRGHLTDTLDSHTCPQTYEFGNYGCAVVEGQVLGARSQPLAGISVGPRPSADGGQFNSPYRLTDGNGRFQLQLTRYANARSES